MPDASEAPIQGPSQDDDLLVIESVTWLDGTPIPRERERPTWGRTAEWRERLTPAGVTALLGGVAMLCCFSFPWFLSPAFGNGPLPDSEAQGPGPLSSVGHAGWSVAAGVDLGPAPGGEPRLALFVHLWLVPLAAVALLLIAWYAAARIMPARLAAGVIAALSALAVLVELGYAVQVLSLSHVISYGGAATISVGAGCWLGVLASVITGAAAANLLRPASDLADEAEGTA